MVALLFATLGRGENPRYAQIVRDRDAVLSEILAAREARYRVGGCDEQAVLSSRLALLTFRRDAAKNREEKLKQQGLIVEMYEKRVADLKVRAKSGTLSAEDLLLAKERLLEAMQTRESLSETATSTN
ncbi:hypothetical protein DB347_20565 [Opitutaceae bacterium EW11]|nr:hypothetical protein DB347_20565 [Opitutaceae bacterium EW11]